MHWTALKKEQLVGTHLRVRAWHHPREEPLNFVGSVHHAVELSWVQGGRVDYELRNQRIEVGPGQLMVVPAGVEHATGFIGGTFAGSLWLGADAFEQLADAMGVKARLEPSMLHDTASLLTIARLLQQEAFEGGAGALMAADALSEVLTLKLLKVAPRSTERSTSPGIRRALDEIAVRYAEPLSVDALASTAAMSRYHFSRRFQEQVGQSPYAYLQQVRLQRAAELLKGGRAGTTEAALSCGFTDLGRFGRKFRERFGCAPSAFKARHHSHGKRGAERYDD